VDGVKLGPILNNMTNKKAWAWCKVDRTRESLHKCRLCYGSKT